MKKTEAVKILQDLSDFYGARFEISGLGNNLAIEARVIERNMRFAKEIASILEAMGWRYCPDPDEEHELFHLVHFDRDDFEAGYVAVIDMY